VADILLRLRGDAPLAHEPRSPLPAEAATAKERKAEENYLAADARR